MNIEINTTRGPMTVSVKGFIERELDGADYCPEEWIEPVFEDGYKKINGADLVRAVKALELLTPKKP